MAEGREDMEIGPLIPENDDNDEWFGIKNLLTGDEDTQYNTIDNSNLSSNPDFDDIKKDSAFLRVKIAEMDTGEDASVKSEERMKVLRNLSFVEGSKWKFTQTNLKELAALVFTAEDVNDEQADELHPNIKPGNYLLSGPNETTLYIIGKNRSGDNTWVRITDKNGKLLKRSTIDGFEGGKRVAEILTYLSHHYQSTGKIAELKQQQENEAAIAEERRKENTEYIRNLGSKEINKQVQEQIRKPTPQRSNTVSDIEDTINSDNENSLTEIIVNSPKPIDKIIDASDDKLKSLGFSDQAIGEMRGLNQAGDDLAALQLEKHLEIEELEKILYDVEKELTKTTEENIDLRYNYEKVKEELTDKLIIEHKKVFDLDNDRESRTSRIKRLITDVLSVL